MFKTRKENNLPSQINHSKGFCCSVGKEGEGKNSLKEKNFLAKSREESYIFFNVMIIMTSLVIVFGFAMLRITEVSSCRQPCGTVEPIRGFRLKEQSYRTYNSVTLERCIILCEQDTGCFSINYFKRTRVCQLNNSTKDDAIEDFVQDNTCLYIDNVLRQHHLAEEQGPHCKCKLVHLDVSRIIGENFTIFFLFPFLNSLKLSFIFKLLDFFFEIRFFFPFFPFLFF